MTAREASDYSKRVDPTGKGLSISYLVRVAKEERIKGAQKIETGPVPYWVFDKTGIDEYLNSPRTPGPTKGRKKKPKAEGET